MVDIFLSAGRFVDVTIYKMHKWDDALRCCFTTCSSRPCPLTSNPVELADRSCIMGCISQQGSRRGRHPLEMDEELNVFLVVAAWACITCGTEGLVAGKAPVSAWLRLLESTSHTGNRLILRCSPALAPTQPHRQDLAGCHRSSMRTTSSAHG